MQPMLAGAKNNLIKIDLMIIEAEEIDVSRIFLDRQFYLD